MGTKGAALATTCKGSCTAAPEPQISLPRLDQPNRHRPSRLSEQKVRCSSAHSTLRSRAARYCRESLESENTGKVRVSYVSRHAVHTRYRNVLCTDCTVSGDSSLGHLGSWGRSGTAILPTLSTFTTHALYTVVTELISRGIYL